MATETTPFSTIAAFAAGSGTFDTAPHLEGLSSKEANRRLQQDGPNVLEAAATESFFKILLTQMRNTIFFLTICAAFVSYAMGDKVKAYVLIGIVCFVCFCNAAGEYSGQDAGAALRKQMETEPVITIRDGREAEIPTHALVVGDVVKLSMGDMVPADMLVLESVDLQTNEAVLTGESSEQRKGVEHGKEGDTFQPNMLYKGTSVVSGEGKAEVVATGMRTQVGLIAKRLKAVGHVDTNPLQQSINCLGTLIGAICMMVILMATSVSYLTGYQNPMTPCADDDDFCLLMTSASRGLLMAVSIIPHGLPFVVMVMLRVGSKEMAVRSAVVTKRSSVDYLGATSVICTDKTGTLTQGKMTAQALMGLCRNASEEPAVLSQLEFYPLGGLSPNGGVFEAKKLSPEAKKRMDAKLDIRQTRQMFCEPGLPDLGDTQEPRSHDLGAKLVQAHLAAGFLNVYATTLYPENGAWAARGNMTDVAVKVAAAKGGLWDEDGQGAALRMTCARMPAVEVPFTSKRKMMATLHMLPEDRVVANIQFPMDATHFAIVKGAPDQLLPRLRTVLSVSIQNPEIFTVSAGTMSVAERNQIVANNAEFATRALRSLLVAICPLTAAEFSELQEAPGAEERLETLLNSSTLCFLSLWGIYDPPRSAVPGSVQECHNAGIRVVMVTGDQYPTAVAIGQQVNIISEGIDPELCASLCTELQASALPVHVPEDHHQKLSRRSSRMLESWSLQPSPRVDASDIGHEPQYRSAEELASLTSRITVWARAQPTDKVTLVESLIRQGHVTAMTGDGVNDAPALKRADAGVAMGITGTAVAQNASDLILMDDDFSTIVAAIREGRRIYSNTQKYVTFNLSIKAGECFCLMAAISAGVPMPIRGLQLLFNLIVTHILPPLSLAWEKPEAYLMQVPPREIKHDLVVSRLLWIFRWLPFVVCMPSMVMCCLMLGVWNNTGFVTSNSLIGTSRTNALELGKVACEFAGTLNDENQFIDDTLPFHCLCHVRPGGNPLAASRRMEQWGQSVDPAQLSQAFDRWTGSAADLFVKENTPWKHGVESLLEPCVDRRGVERWCWREDPTEEGRPWLPSGRNCAAYGAQVGQSMAYVSIHMGELLTLLTFRTDDSFVRHAFSNHVYVLFFVFNLSMLTIFLYVPSIADLLQLVPLNPLCLGIAASFAIGIAILNEFVKVFYRIQLRAQNDVLSKVALQRGRNMLPPKEII